MGRKKKTFKELVKELKELKNKGGSSYLQSKYNAWKIAQKTQGRARVFKNKKKELTLKKVKVRYY